MGVANKHLPEIALALLSNKHSRVLWKQANHSTFAQYTNPVQITNVNFRTPASLVWMWCEKCYTRELRTMYYYRQVYAKEEKITVTLGYTRSASYDGRWCG